MNVAAPTQPTAGPDRAVKDFPKASDFPKALDRRAYQPIVGAVHQQSEPPFYPPRQDYQQCMLHSANNQNWSLTNNISYSMPLTDNPIELHINKSSTNSPTDRINLIDSVMTRGANIGIPPHIEVKPEGRETYAFGAGNQDTGPLNAMHRIHYRKRSRTA